jgi:hypothetical protein
LYKVLFRQDSAFFVIDSDCQRYARFAILVITG